MLDIQIWCVHLLVQWRMRESGGMKERRKGLHQRSGRFGALAGAPAGFFWTAYYHNNWIMPFVGAGVGFIAAYLFWVLLEANLEIDSF